MWCTSTHRPKTYSVTEVKHIDFTVLLSDPHNSTHLWSHMENVNVGAKCLTSALCIGGLKMLFCNYHCLNRRKASLLQHREEKNTQKLTINILDQGNFRPSKRRTRYTYVCNAQNITTSSVKNVPAARFRPENTHNIVIVVVMCVLLKLQCAL